MQTAQTRKGFTLVELMVAMAIVAVLIGLSVFGISTAQRVLRDNQRRDAVNDIAVLLNAYYAERQEYPSRINIAAAGAQLVFANDTTKVIPLNGIAKTATGITASDATKTLYCYALTSTGYLLGVKLEDGGQFDLGSASNQKCTFTTDRIV